MMNHLLNSDFKVDSELVHNPAMDEIINSPIVQQEDCILLYVLAKNNTHYNRKYFADRVAYESFINHVHITDLLEESQSVKPSLFLLEQGIALANAFRRKLILAYPDTAFRIDLGYDETDCNVRFYCDRDDEPSWLAADLEGYKDEAVMVLEVKPENSCPSRS